MNKYNSFSLVLLVTFSFVVIQLLGGLAMGIMLELWNSSENSAPSFLTNSHLLALAVTHIFTGGLCIAFLQWKKIIHLPAICSTLSLPQKPAIWGALGTILFIAAIDLLNEQIGFPDMQQDVFIALAHNVWGIMALVLVGPLIEELVFREGILGNLLRRGMSPYGAILISAFCFSVVHMNPAQIVPTFFIGVVFGLLYYKTQHILLPTLLHIANNGMAVMEMNILGDKVKTFSYEVLLGGALNTWVILILCGIGSMVLLSLFWKKY